MSAVVQPSPGVARLRLKFGADKNALLEDFAGARPSAKAAIALTRGLARLVDATLAELWITSGMPAGAALVAAGGYGRGELFPHSDVDVLVLLPDDQLLETVQPSVERFIAACWDIGLEIGSSVRNIEECAFEAARDVTVQTALLESRHVTGAKKLFVALRERLARDMDPRTFLRAKTLEMRQRHTKYQETPYALEPNCKESPGGLRDLQMLLWVARAAGLGRSWAELAAKGLATPFEVKQLQRNEGVLKMIRARLHALAGRREDRLVFDLQTAVAESFGLHAKRGQRVSELLMRRYYWAAKAVVQLNQILLLNIEERILGSESMPMRRLNDRFLDRGGMIEVASDDLYERDPHAILETFLVYAQEVGVKALSARTLRALYNARHLMNARFRSDPVNRARFIEILRQEAGQTHALRLMNQTSVLGRYLWVFRRIVGQMQHDLFHVYTVDQHILMVVRNMRRFFIAEHAHEYPFCSQLGADFERPYVLYVAALFHDVAKGRGGDHSQLGAAEARRFCRDHAVPAEDARLIEFLVRHHLTMSHTAQKEDLSDPDVIAAFAKTVGDTRALTALYLLTVADIRGTSPKVWNAWKGKLLEDLYRLTRRVLSAEGDARPSTETEVEQRKAEARALLALASQLPGTEKPLWETMDLGYFMRHDPADLAWHARVLWRHVRWARACRCWSMRPTCPTCSHASAATSTTPASRCSMPRCTPRVRSPGRPKAGRRPLGGQATQSPWGLHCAVMASTPSSWCTRRSTKAITPPTAT
jgi:[protein-PII] uridylyltransferase